jgi:hypothetical protein
MESVGLVPALLEEPTTSAEDIAEDPNFKIYYIFLSKFPFP